VRGAGLLAAVVGIDSLVGGWVVVRLFWGVRRVFFLPVGGGGSRLRGGVGGFFLDFCVFFRGGGLLGSEGGCCDFGELEGRVLGFLSSLGRGLVGFFEIGV